MSSSLVAIVGRPNVGKSTLFNRLVGMRQAITDETAGVTRDRHYGRCEWCGTEFSVVDTGGYTVNSDDIFEEEIRKQVQIAIKEADAIMFMVEVETGITDFDSEIADILRRTEKPVFLVVNKVDTGLRMYDVYQFYSLGLGDPFSISSANGGGTGDLLDAMVKVLPQEKKEAKADIHIPRIAIVGKPNVGKSSLTNALLGEERNIVTPIAGTTRDSIESHYNKFGHEFTLIDTAGLRKKTKVTEDLEFYSVMRSVRAIENADICILMVDALSGLEAQDMSIFNLIIKNRKGCVVAVNKWDTVEKDGNTMKEYRKTMAQKLAPFSDVPVVFTSVLNKQRILDVLDAVDMVYQNYSQKIPTRELNDVMLEEIEAFQPPMYKGKIVKIKFITQLPTQFPSFAFFCNLPQYIKEPYKRFLENKLRSHWTFAGCPIQIFFRQK